MAIVCGFKAIVLESSGGSDIRADFSLEAFSSRKLITDRRKSAPWLEMLSASHLSRLRYSLRDARAATSSAKVNGRTSNNASRICDDNALNADTINIK